MFAGDDESLLDLASMYDIAAHGVPRMGRARPGLLRSLLFFSQKNKIHENLGDYLCSG